VPRYHEAVDVEKTIEFILEQQAKFAAGLEQLQEQMRQQGQINMAFGKALLGVTEHIDRLAAAQATTDERLNRLVDAQAATDERLNALIAVVDGIVRRPPANG
jgi:hypothetical protein